MDFFAQPAELHAAKQCLEDGRKEPSMSGQAIFTQECPVCGRPLEIHKKYHGKKVVCPQCGGAFIAVDAERDPWNIWDQNNRLLRKADQLLERYATCGAASN
jgi:uncharacterized Zn finger protein (UPF0148 family)